MTRQILMAGSVDNPATGSVEYCGLEGAYLWQSAEDGCNMVAATGGTLSHLRVEIATAPGAGKSYTFAVMLNGSPTSLSVAISGASDTSGEDIANTVTVAAGDLLSLRCTPAGAPAATRTRSACIFTHTASSTAMHGASQSALTNSATRYTLLGASTSGWSWNATESNRRTMWNVEATIVSLYVRLAASPGAGKSYAFTIMKNGSAEGSSTVTISDAATTGSVTGLTIDVTAGDRFSLRSVPSGTPTSTIATWGIAYTTDTNNQWSMNGVQFAGSEPATPSYHFLSPDVSGFDATEANRLMLGGAATGAVSATATSLMARMVNAPGVGNSRAFTLYVANAPSSLVATVSGASNTGTGTGSVVIAPGDDVSYRHDETGTAANPDQMEFALLLSVPDAGAGNSHLLLMGVG